MSELCWPHRLALVGLFCAVSSFSGDDLAESLVGLSAAARCEMNRIYTFLMFG